MRRWLLLVPALAVVGLAPALGLLRDEPLVVPPSAQPRELDGTDAEILPDDITSMTAAEWAVSDSLLTDVQQGVDATRRTAIVRAAERVAPAVVSVNVVRRESYAARSLWESFFMPPGAARDVPGLGSGFVIDAQGRVLTNEHVVRGATEIVVTLRDGRDFAATLVGADEVTDLALLQLRDVRGSLPVAPLGSSANLIIGEWVVAIGNPFGFMLANAEATVTAGVVSGVGRNIIPEGSTSERGWYLDMIQTDASINPGNSGRPAGERAGRSDRCELLDHLRQWRQRRSGLRDSRSIGRGASRATSAARGRVRRPGSARGGPARAEPLGPQPPGARAAGRAGVARRGGRRAAGHGHHQRERPAGRIAAGLGGAAAGLRVSARSSTSWCGRARPPARSARRHARPAVAVGGARARHGRAGAGDAHCGHPLGAETGQRGGCTHRATATRSSTATRRAR
jgi:S1-C subfamily serine protease